MDGMIDVPRYNYTALMQAVVKHPVATAVCCGPYLDYWHAYTGGIMDIEGTPVMVVWQYRFHKSLAVQMR